MPTTLPASSRSEDRRLTLHQTVVFLVLITRIRILDVHLAALYGVAERRGHDPHGPTLLRLVRRWLDCHEKIAALLGLPPPPHVAQVQAVLKECC